ncbi:MAG: AMMECR1 domain-containing protein, partial [Planctomycetaceae bacterium]
YEGNRRGTLLPAVWQKIADPRDFFATVKQKAGLSADYWSATLRVERYTATSVGGKR